MTPPPYLTRGAVVAILAGLAVATFIGGVGWWIQ